MTRRVAKTFQSSLPDVKDVKQIAVRRLTSLLYYSAESRQLTIATTTVEESLNKDTTTSAVASYHSEITTTRLPFLTPRRLSKVNLSKCAWQENK